MALQQAPGSITAARTTLHHPRALLDCAQMIDHPLEIETATAAWKKRGWPSPSVLVVSGSGLAVDLEARILAEDTLQGLLPFQVRTVVGHEHRVQLLETKGGVVLYQRGRLHSYQGYDACQTVFVVRVAGLLGAHTLLMSNAAGGLVESQKPGDIAAISDQINLIGLNPLRGNLPPDWGPQFPDMVNAHDPQLRSLAVELGSEIGIEVGEGVYAGVAGPSFETPAEVEMLRRLGAHLVGMSTVLEVIAARHLGMRCLCLSLVANLAAGMTAGPVDHNEVLEECRASATAIGNLLDALLGRPELYSND